VSQPVAQERDAMQVQVRLLSRLLVLLLERALVAVGGVVAGVFRRVDEVLDLDQLL
jgi:hypothetical protein